MTGSEEQLPTNRGDDPDRWRSRKWRGDWNNRMNVRNFRTLVLVHRWEMWKRASND